MPNYAKFLKDIFRNRRTCDVVETVNFTKNCSAIIMNKIPPKLKDPGRFFITCAIYKMQIDNTLCDLGASVSPMPYSVEDFHLRVGKFVIPVDFVVLEMDEDASIPIILGRPFLATSGAMINVKSAKISHKLGDKVIEFYLNDSMKYPCSYMENCMMIDSLDSVVSSMYKKFLTSNDALENVLLNKENIGSPSKEMNLYADVLNGSL
ncbi:uncharacterized protein LOC110695579 [Chenopodium quinoa]|uniref:uncharacterized protein LOC110695579 n=1 Tax=Chenopodium quinoa TaxID=63459 RepID=UPI000B798AB6|nr:uncharacterized protein LOC110695579 [Chenopodium quinoa]